VTTGQDSKTQPPTAAGVEALIERLREEGVARGRDEAERLAREAEARAAAIERKARQEADSVLETARREAEALRTAGEDALRLAMRDTVLELRAALTREVNDKVRRLISAELQREAFLQQLILEVARRGRDEVGIEDGDRLDVVLPRELVSLEELRQNPLELREGSLSHFVLAVASEVLGDGVRFTVAEDEQRGIRIRLEDRHLEIDLTEEKVADLIISHLQPRFRAVLEGTVK
jgi:V/A-type H+-transporting ATPase subunit E